MGTTTAIEETPSGRMTKSDTFKITAPVAITDAHRQEITDALIGLYNKLMTSRVVADRAKASFATDKKKIEPQMDYIYETLTARAEMQEVDAHWKYDWTDGTKELVREDTGEVIENALVTDAERQPRLPVS